jgi:hypothetical protein
MDKTTYDPDGDGIVSNSAALGGNAASHFAVAADLTSHVGATGNPHSVTAAQVGNATAQWNANKLQGTSVNASAPADGQYLYYNGTEWIPTTPSFSVVMSKAITVPGPLAGDSFPMWIPKEPITILNVRGVTGPSDNTGSVTANLFNGTSDISDTDWTLDKDSSGTDQNITNANIGANAVLLFKVNTVTDAPDYVNLTVYYTID